MVLMLSVILMASPILSLVVMATQRCTNKPCIIFYALGSSGTLLGMALCHAFSKKSMKYLRKWFVLNEEWTLMEI